jgi:hypothetical protein
MICEYVNFKIVNTEVELVDKGDVRHVAQPADLEELAGLFLGALMGPLGEDILTG